MNDSRHIFNTQNDGGQWTPSQRIPSAEFFALPDDEIRTLFPGVDDFAAGLMNDGATAGQKQEGA